MDHDTKQMRDRNCPNVDDSPFSSFQESDHKERPKLISHKGGDAKFVETDVFVNHLTKKENS